MYSHPKITMLLHAMMTEVDFSAFSRNKGGVHNMSKPLPKEYSLNWGSYFFTFLFYTYIYIFIPFLINSVTPFKAKKSLHEQQFLKT